MKCPKCGEETHPEKIETGSYYPDYGHTWEEWREVCDTCNESFDQILINQPLKNVPTIHQIRPSNYP